MLLIKSSKIKKFYVFLIFFYFFLSCSSQEDALAHYKEGIQAYSERNLKTAIEKFEQASKEDKEMISSRIMLGKSYYYSGRFDDARKVFEKVVDDFPGNSNAHSWLGRILLNEDAKREEAKRHLVYATQSDDSQVDALYYLGKAYEQEGKIKEALLEYHKALEIKRKFDKIHRDLSELYRKAGLEERANEQSQSRE
ncbi:tetratricopeptide repeat protein [Leptospira yasudae]|uniref:tetratricopeptide repeat protein n=1 Tax=Leptospira yasudae TaxID=2202201 RepID=UPI0010911296|nr:tetratricopeptide repeat protein [Leptospira yasudae]MBW0433644.1 tetratricopeptide repeat protein [Leptospira yasudae]TGN00418.1 tetratricopeptide repeat protein [Leptospira yasudae]